MNHHNRTFRGRAYFELHNNKINFLIVQKNNAKRCKIQVEDLLSNEKRDEYWNKFQIS